MTSHWELCGVACSLRCCLSSDWPPSVSIGVLLGLGRVLANVRNISSIRRGMSRDSGAVWYGVARYGAWWNQIITHVNDLKGVQTHPFDWHVTCVLISLLFMISKVIFLSRLGIYLIDVGICTIFCKMGTNSVIVGWHLHVDQFGKNAFPWCLGHSDHVWGSLYK